MTEIQKSEEKQNTEFIILLLNKDN